MTYAETIEFLFGIRLFGQKLGLDTMRELLRLMGNPQDRLRFIHIAGTNGKGSVGAMCHAVLATAGIRTGFYTSPHLVSFCERFQINGQPMAEADAVRLVEQLRPLMDAVGQNPAFRQPTFFEVVTAMALQHFADQNVDVVVWETGMGGRLDATNVVTPLASVITNIGLDHMQYLGATLTDIAREKAGIIKPGIPAVTAAREPEALTIIRARCAELQAPLVEVDTVQTVRQLAENLDGQTLRVTTSRHDYGEVRLPLLGHHQMTNVATAVATLEATGLNISPETIRDGLAATRWPGRFEVIHDLPVVILDGAHNPPAAAELAATVRRLLAGRRIGLILGVMADKEYRRVCDQLAPLAKRIDCVRVANDRTCDPNTLASCCRSANPDATVAAHDDVVSAYHAARAAQPDVILITGSLFLIGEAMNRLDLPQHTRHVSQRELILQ
jgi:dihydrofolate synthase/folylpolyglutamate synthase